MNLLNDLWDVDEQFKYQFTEKEKRKKVEQIISDECREDGINIKELRSGSRVIRSAGFGFVLQLSFFRNMVSPLQKWPETQVSQHHQYQKW